MITIQKAGKEILERLVFLFLFFQEAKQFFGRSNFLPFSEKA